MLTSQDHDAISRLHLLARGVVEGIAAGRHRSPHKGSSVEFKEHRQYVRGDEIRSIDWKLFGKTDRLFIRQYEDETNLRGMILVDQSGSMAYRGSRSALSKHEFAVRLAACLATLLISQQDSVGVATLDTRLQQVVAPRSKPSHLQAIMTTLAESRTGGETQLSDALKQASSSLRRRGVLILISDCFDDVRALLTALRYFAHAGTEVVVFQIWDPDELDFPFRKRTRFRSLESSKVELLLDPVALRTAYLQRLADYRAQLGQGFARERISLIPCSTDQDYGQILSAYLGQRSRKTANPKGGQRLR